MSARKKNAARLWYSRASRESQAMIESLSSIWPNQREIAIITIARGGQKEKSRS